MRHQTIPYLTIPSVRWREGAIEASQRWYTRLVVGVMWVPLYLPIPLPGLVRVLLQLAFVLGVVFMMGGEGVVLRRTARVQVWPDGIHVRLFVELGAHLTLAGVTCMVLLLGFSGLGSGPLTRIAEAAIIVVLGGFALMVLGTVVGIVQDVATGVRLRRMRRTRRHMPWP